MADLAAMLCDMGAVVRGAGTSRIEIEGVEELRPARHAVVPDRVVAATYVAAVGMAGGEVTIEDARADHMENLLRKVQQMGVTTEMTPQGLRASAPGSPARGGRRHPAVSRCGHRLQPASGRHAHRGRRRRHLDREPVLGSVPLRRGAAADGCGHPDRGASRRRPRRAPALGRARARARHPRRCRTGSGRSGGRGSDDGRAGRITSTGATRIWRGRCVRSAPPCRAGERTRPRR